MRRSERAQEQAIEAAVLICPLNVSEGRRERVRALAAAAGDDVLDVHTDAWHHRSVITLAGEAAPRAVAEAAVAAIDLRRHHGAHPRLGAVDVVPFVPAAGDDLSAARAARDRFATWAAGELGLPAFAYDGGDTPELGEPTLPQVRREAFRALRPTAGPGLPHPTAGAVAVGARRVLVAYNLWLAEPDLGLARRIAAAVRGPAVRALGLRIGHEVQVSLNLVDPAATGPDRAWDLVADHGPIVRAELVGLLPEAVLHAVPESRWEQLDLAPDRTVESRLARRGGADGA